MPALNYTTSVPVSRTVGEVQSLLAAAGADAVMVRYVDRQPVAVSFVLRTPHGDRQFTLPVNADGVHRLLVQQHRATLDQVMLPYLHVEGELTLYDVYREREQRALMAGAS